MALFLPATSGFSVIPQPCPTNVYSYHDNSRMIYSIFSFIFVHVQNFPVIMGQSTVVEILMQEQRVMLNIFM